MNAPASSFSRVAVVGAGLVGSSWAVVFARAGLQVNLYDADAAQLRRSRAQIERALGELAAASLLHGSVAESLARVQDCDSLAACVAGAQYVQESIAESLPAKRELFAALDAGAEAHTILASSTSAFATSAMAEALPGRSRIVVAHPVNPPHLVPFVEVSGAPFTQPGVVAQTLAFMKAVGMLVGRHKRATPDVNNIEELTVAEKPAARLKLNDRPGDGAAERWVYVVPLADHILLVTVSAPAGRLAGLESDAEAALDALAFRD